MFYDRMLCTGIFFIIRQQIYDKRTGKAIDNRYLFLMFALEFFISVAFCRRNIWTATNYVVFLIKYYTQFP